MKAKTLYRKLVDSHTVATLDEQNVLLFCDLHLMNEYTSPQAFAGLHEKNRNVAMPGQNVAVVSHIIPTHPVENRVIFDPSSALQASNLKRNCVRHDIALFDTNDALQGIEHIIAPEHGMIRPGMVVICGDSHTTTYGALGALGFGIGTSEVEHVLATQTLVYRLAQDMRIRIDGQLPIGTTSKDLILMRKRSTMCWRAPQTSMGTCAIERSPTGQPCTATMAPCSMWSTASTLPRSHLT